MMAVVLFLDGEKSIVIWDAVSGASGGDQLPFPSWPAQVHGSADLMCTAQLLNVQNPDA